MYLESSVANLCMPSWECNLCSSAEEILEPQQSQRPQADDPVPGHGDIPVNPYHVLQVRRDATPSEIRLSYTRLALWHHPGRMHECMEERQRRLQVFQILAACYETLVNPESRRIFDADVKDMETHKLTKGLTGHFFVGGKRLIGSDTPGRSVMFADDVDRIPALSNSSTHSSSSSDEEEDGPHMMLCSPTNVCCSDKMKARSLVDASNSGSGSDLEAEVHYTEADTTRQFGGPLTHLYRVRNFEPFTDPFLVFEKVFGSQIFKVDPQEIGQLKQWMPLRTTRAAGWHGSSEKTPDGKRTVFTTSRVLHDRRLTRTETLTVDPMTGQAQSFVSVTSQDMELEEEEDVPTGNACLICYQSTNSPVAESDYLCGDFYLLYDNLVEEIDMYQNWINVFHCNPDMFPKWS